MIVGERKAIDKIPFHSYFIYRDILDFFIILMLLAVLTLCNTYGYI